MVGLDSRGIGERSALASVEPSITWGTINNIKTTEVPLVLRARVFGGIFEVRESCETWAFSVLRVALIMGDRSGLVGI
jgi:hypothetical protein